MDREQAINYLRSSGYSEEQIQAIEGAFTCDDCISKQAAIDAVREGQTYITKISPDGYIEHLFEKENDALEEAAMRIEDLPLMKMCGGGYMSDLISRQAAIDLFKKWQPYMATRIHEFEKELYALPPVEQKQGKWILTADKEHGRCSNCGHEEDLVNGHSSYGWCSNCGTKMCGGEE